MLNVKKLLTKILDALKEDYIVEQGGSGDWRYRKWASGTAECWCIASVNVTSYVAWQGWYYSTPNCVVTFPTNLFNDTPVVNAVRQGGAEGTTVVGAVTKTKIDTLYILRPNSGGTGTMYFSVYAIGTWK